MQVLLKANMLVETYFAVPGRMEEYFCLWSNKIIRISYPVKLDWTKRKHKTINLHIINVLLNWDTESHWGLMFKKKIWDYKNGHWKQWVFAANKTTENKHSKKVKGSNEKKQNSKIINSFETKIYLFRLFKWR